MIWGVIMSDKKLQYQDENGNIGEGQTITDLERNNALIERGIKVLWYFAGLFTLCFVLVLWMIFYIIRNDVVNNIVGACM